MGGGGGGGQSGGPGVDVVEPLMDGDLADGSASSRPSSDIGGSTGTFGGKALVTQNTAFTDAADKESSAGQ